MLRKLTVIVALGAALAVSTAADARGGGGRGGGGGGWGHGGALGPAAAGAAATAAATGAAAIGAGIIGPIMITTLPITTPITRTTASPSIKVSRFTMETRSITLTGVATPRTVIV